MNYTKIVGWIIFVVGITIIGWTLLSSYNIFTGKTAVPEIFPSSAESYGGPAGALSEGGETPQDIQAQMEQMMGEQLKGIFPADALPKILNLVIWSMLAFILISGGGQISGLGIKLIKK